MISQVTTLSNGVRVATCEMPQAQTAAIGIWAGVGGRHEPERLCGISHFIEHMLFKGTARRSARQITQAIEGIGGDINAYTCEEKTCYYAVAAAEYFPRVADVVCDIYAEPKFAPVEIERERGVITEEILMYRDEPGYYVQELFNEIFWPKHPLGRPLTGSLQSIEQFSRQDFLDYRQSHYGALNTVVTASGKVNHEAVCRFMQQRLATLPRGRRSKTKPAGLYQSGGKIRVEYRDIQQTHAVLGVPAFHLHDDRRHVLNLLNIILGGNASSRLFQELRERRGLCYSVGSHVSQFSDCGNLSISLALDLKKLGQSLQLILREFERLRRDGCRPGELKRAKEYAIGSSRMALERPSSQNSRLGNCLLAFGKILDPEEMHQRTRAVTTEEIQAVAAELLRPEFISLAAIGPIRDESDIRAAF